MAFQFDNRVSWMDVIAIAGAGMTALTVIFGVQSDVEMNSARITEVDRRLETEVKRLSGDLESQNRTIIREIEGIESEIKEIRSESAVGRQRIEEKLDRLIERQL